MEIVQNIDFLLKKDRLETVLSIFVILRKTFLKHQTKKSTKADGFGWLSFAPT